MVFYVVGAILLACGAVYGLVKWRRQAARKAAEAASLEWVRAVEAADTPEKLFKLHPHQPNWSAGERYLSDRQRLDSAVVKQATGDVVHRVSVLQGEYNKLKERQAPPHELLAFCVCKVSGYQCGSAMAEIVGITDSELPDFAHTLLGKTLAAAYGGDAEACNVYKKVVHELSGNSFFTDCHIARPSLPQDWEQVVIACAEDPLSVPLSG